MRAPRRVCTPIDPTPPELADMTGRLIPWLVGSMTVAMLVVVAVQVNWLESSAKLRKEVFDQSVE